MVYQYIPGRLDPLLSGWSLPNYACEIVEGSPAGYQWLDSL